MVFGFWGDDNETEDEVEIAHEGLREASEIHEIIEKEVVGDSLREERAKKLLEQKGVNPENLNPTKNGDGVRYLVAVARIIVIREIVEEGIGEVESRIQEVEQDVEVEESEWWDAEDKIKEAEIHIEENIGTLKNDLRGLLEYLENFEKLPEMISPVIEHLENLIDQQKNGSKETSSDIEIEEELEEVREFIQGLKNHDNLESAIGKINEDKVHKQEINNVLERCVEIKTRQEDIRESITKSNQAIQLCRDSIEILESNNAITGEVESINSLNHSETATIANLVANDNIFQNFCNAVGRDPQGFAMELRDKEIRSAIKTDYLHFSYSRKEDELNSLEQVLNDVEGESEEIVGRLESLEEEAEEILTQLNDVDELTEEILDYVESLNQKLSELNSVFREKIEGWERNKDKFEEMLDERKYNDRWEEIQELESFLPNLEEFEQDVETVESNLVKLDQFISEEEQGIKKGLNKLASGN